MGRSREVPELAKLIGDAMREVSEVQRDAYNAAANVYDGHGNRVLVRVQSTRLRGDLERLGELVRRSSRLMDELDLSAGNRRDRACNGKDCAPDDMTDDDWSEYEEDVERRSALRQGKAPKG